MRRLQYSVMMSLFHLENTRNLLNVGETHRYDQRETLRRRDFSFSHRYYYRLKVQENRVHVMISRSPTKDRQIE